MHTLGSQPQARLSLVAAQMLLCSFLWGASFLFIKVIGEALSPLALTAVRGVMGGALLALWLGLQRDTPWPRGSEWRDFAILGFVQGILPNTLTAFALTRLPAGLTAFLQASTPLVVALAAHVLFTHERMSLARAAGVALGFAGIAVLLGPGALAGEGGDLLGCAAMGLTVVSYAVGNLYVGRLGSTQPLRLAFGQQAFAGIPTFAVVLAMSGPAAFAPAGDHMLALAGLGIFATALPIVLYMNILRAAGPTLGSMYGYLIPVWTVLLAAALLGEQPSPRQLLGGAVVLAGLLVVALTKRAPASAKAAGPAAAAQAAR